MGNEKKGEIHKLSKILKPNIAIITNIAEAHIENFKILRHSKAKVRLLIISKLMAHCIK